MPETTTILIKKVPCSVLEKLDAKRMPVKPPRSLIVRAALRMLADMPADEYRRVITEQSEIEQART
jgi:hypothetical protein